MSDESWASPHGVRKAMQGARGRENKPELALRRALHALALRYFVGRHPILSLRRTVDLVLPRVRMAVFLDGCFRHGCGQHHTVARMWHWHWVQPSLHCRRLGWQVVSGK